MNKKGSIKNWSRGLTIDLFKIGLTFGSSSLELTETERNQIVSNCLILGNNQTSLNAMKTLY